MFWTHDRRWGANLCPIKRKSIDKETSMERSNNKTTLLIYSHWQVPSDINVDDCHSSCTKKAKNSSRFQAWTTMKSKGVYCGYQVASQTHKANVQNNTKLQTQGWFIVQFHNQKKTHAFVDLYGYDCDEH